MSTVYANCLVCNTQFVSYRGFQKFCSKECREKAWATTFRKRAAEKSRERRKANPEWYRAREPGYYKTYRAKLTSIRPWKYLLQSRRYDARNKNLPFDLTNEWAAARWTGKCEITGIAFGLNGKRGPFPFSPSVDRIDPTKGYTQDNCRFVLWGCNAIKGVGTDADMYKIACAIAASISTINVDHS
jgi:hypothetical protein